MNQLEQLKQRTTIVADSGDIDSIMAYQPEDATTNPSLIYKAAQLPQYQKLVKDAVAAVKSRQNGKPVQPADIADYLAVSIGVLILKNVPGRISTEVDARLSFDTQASIAKAREIIALYEEKGIGKDRVLIKLAATWQGIRAAETLEKEGIQCNLTLLFSFAQARACADANVFLISPFVGRIYDWYKKNNPDTTFTVENDPGVESVQKIYRFYKMHGYRTVVMGASFRTPEQVLALNGCDRLTVSPALLAQLQQTQGAVPMPLTYEGEIQAKPTAMTEAEFYWAHNQDAMAVEKLAEGIRLFAVDQNSLESLLSQYL
ncbi:MULTISPECIES: transaldolase [Enterobacteriaceae]|uniref:transaldolase n=1 Tax=Enterobacteriaceae TaxID=543 RepID=UPI00125B4253|nr:MULTISPECIES: transaldolase [Enterobacteriaceae]HDR2548058.1 transaldolase [Enterobacter ludwigii]MDK8078174.1 transaldolase [Citrobacter freundii]MDK8589099.1 transaldolase [Citrobacter freundii]VAC97372.1 transaldolase B [Klebsiella aerogenes]HDR2576319.1 transaldolase [Enterobacter ludwigii]